MSIGAKGLAMAGAAETALLLAPWPLRSTERPSVLTQAPLADEGGYSPMTSERKILEVGRSSNAEIAEARSPP
jgi:hypothetical protein